MSTNEKQYFDADGKPISLYKLVRIEPEWAQARIKAGEDAIKERDTYRELCGELIRALSAINERDLTSVDALITKAEQLLGEKK